MGTLVAKIKSAPILMATISITFLGAVISFIITLVMAEWALGYLEMRVPFDVEIRNNYSHSFISEANISNGYEEISLKDNEFTTQWYSVVTDEEINSFLKDNSTLNIDDINLKISKNYSHSFISEANISNANELPALDYSEVVDCLNEKGYDVNNYCEVKKYFINEEEYYNIDQKNISMIGIRLSDFNKMRRMLGYIYAIL